VKYAVPHTNGLAFTPLLGPHYFQGLAFENRAPRPFTAASVCGPNIPSTVTV
jgi:hypothetical protein